MCYRSIYRMHRGSMVGRSADAYRHGGLPTLLLSWLCCSGLLGLLVIYVQCSCMQIWIGRSRNSETVLQVVDLLVVSGFLFISVYRRPGRDKSRRACSHMLQATYSRTETPEPSHCTLTLDSAEQGYKEIWKIVRACLRLQCMRKC